MCLLSLDAAGVRDKTPAMKKVLSLLCLIVTCSLSSAGEPAKIPPKEASEWLGKTPEAQLLDVRTAEEFAGGHLAKAVLIPWTEPGFEERVRKQLEANKPVLVYCRSGRRSAAAASALAKLGFTGIRDLDGGIVAWEKAGEPVIKSE